MGGTIRPAACAGTGPALDSPFSVHRYGCHPSNGGTRVSVGPFTGRCPTPTQDLQGCPPNGRRGTTGKGVAAYTSDTASSFAVSFYPFGAACATALRGTWPTEGSTSHASSGGCFRASATCPTCPGVGPCVGCAGVFRGPSSPLSARNPSG